MNKYNATNEKKLLKNLMDIRQSEIQIITELESRFINDAKKTNFFIDELINNISAKIYFSNNKYLLIDTPLMFKNSENSMNRNELRILPDIVEKAVNLYETKTGNSLYGLINAPYHFYMIRKVKNISNPNIADCDHVESVHISNLIAKKLGLSDSPISMSCTSTCVEACSKEDIGTSFVFFEEKYLSEFIEMFLKDKSLKWVREHE